MLAIEISRSSITKIKNFKIINEAGQIFLLQYGI